MRFKNENIPGTSIIVRSDRSAYITSLKLVPTPVTDYK